MTFKRHVKLSAWQSVAITESLEMAIEAGRLDRFSAKALIKLLNDAETITVTVPASKES